MPQPENTSILVGDSEQRAPTLQELEVQFEEFEKFVSQNYFLFFETSLPLPNEQRESRSHRGAVARLVR